MKKIIFSTIATVTLLSGSVLLPVQNVKADAVENTKKSAVVQEFKDVKGHWAQDVISKANDLNLISGYEDGTFRPNAKITRAEYATLLSRATKLIPASMTTPFNDLKGHWSETAVTQLVSLGFINPADYPKGFNPNAELTRYEMMKWISSGLMKSNDSFTEAFNDTRATLLPSPEAMKGQISSEKIPYLALVKGTGIVGGFEDGSFKPSNTTTRAEVAAILLRYMNVEGTEAGKYSDLNELREVGLTGTNLTSISNYKYIRGSFQDIRDTDITLRNKSGKMKLKRYIVVDATSGKAKSVYAPLFIDKLHDVYKGQYVTYMEMSFISNLDKANLLTFSQGSDTSIVQFNRLHESDHINKMGITTPPADSTTYIKRGIEKTFWTTSILKKNNVSYLLNADNGKVMQIYN